MTQVWLREDIRDLWHGDVFAAAAAQPGEVFREREGRRTLRFRHNGRSYFLKYHGGIGWKEILKNLVQLRAPVLGAGSELRAIRKLESVGIPTMTIAGFGVRGSNPARQESFLVTDDLAGTLSLEEIGEHFYRHCVNPMVKWKLIRRVASTARKMHDAGVNHRDFYLGHFLLQAKTLDEVDPDAPLYLIDLHRAQVRRRVPRRWRLKDLGGLYFSTARLGMTHRDLLRFVRAYTGMNLRDALDDKHGLLEAARREAEKVYRRYFGIEPAFPLQFCAHPGKDI